MKKAHHIALSQLVQLRTSWQFTVDLWASVFVFDVTYIHKEKTYKITSQHSPYQSLYLAKKNMWQRPSLSTAREILRNYVSQLEYGHCAQCLHGCGLPPNCENCTSCGGNGLRTA